MGGTVEAGHSHYLLDVLLRLEEYTCSIVQPGTVHMFRRRQASQGLHPFVKLGTPQMHQLGKLLHGEILVGNVLAKDGLKSEQELPVFLVCQDVVWCAVLRGGLLCRLSQQVLDALHQHLPAERLYDVVGGTGTQTAQLVCIVVEGRQVDNGDVGIQAGQVTCLLSPYVPVVSHVHQYEGGVLFGDECFNVRRIFSCHHVEVGGQRIFQVCPVVVVFCCDEDGLPVDGRWRDVPCLRFFSMDGLLNFAETPLRLLIHGILFSFHLHLHAIQIVELLNHVHQLQHSP